MGFGRFRRSRAAQSRRNRPTRPMPAFTFARRRRCKLLPFTHRLVDRRYLRGLKAKFGFDADPTLIRLLMLLLIFRRSFDLGLHIIRSSSPEEPARKFTQQQKPINFWANERKTVFWLFRSQDSIIGSRRVWCRLPAGFDMLLACIAKFLISFSRFFVWV